jgi:glutathione peroxidase
MDFYSFEAEQLNGKKVKMEEYKGKTVVVVNTASKCGLTPQYEGLEKLSPCLQKSRSTEMARTLSSDT